MTILGDVYIFANQNTFFPHHNLSSSGTRFEGQGVMWRHD